MLPIHRFSVSPIPTILSSLKWMFICSIIMSDDGNPRGSWFAVICLLVSMFMWIGIIKGQGIMLPTLTEQFTTETWLTGWLMVIVSGSIYLTGKVCFKTCYRIGMIDPDSETIQMFLCQSGPKFGQNGG